jgi:methylmalonyl-CoA/ethylmalonyl-CoA epimerase
MENIVKANWFGADATFHHVGMAVPTIKPVGKEMPRVFDDPIQGVSVAFFDNAGCCIELIAPLRENSPVTAALKKGQKLVHLCFEVASMDAAIKTGATNGFRCVAKPVPAVAFQQRRIAWVFSSEYGLVELLERHSEPSFGPDSRV